MENTEFFIDKDGFKLHTKLEFPDSQSEKMPVAIILHGLTGNMEEEQIKRAAKAATRAGMAALRVELYGHGSSDGDFANHTVMEWVSETLFVIDYARALSFASEIILMGHSQGGLTAILAAGLKADQIYKLVLLSAATNIVEYCNTGIFFETKFDVNNLPETLTFWGDKTIKSNYLRVGKVLPVAESIQAYNGPVLLLHGATDGAVLPECSIENAKKYAHSKLVLIPEDGHCYEIHPELLEDNIYKFLSQE